jgi:hypothetical protein
MICTGSLTSLFRKLKAQEGKFIFASVYAEDDWWKRVVENNIEPHYKIAQEWVHNGLGNPYYLSLFDDEYDPYGRCPFNSGNFASARNVITEGHLNSLNKREIKFYKNILKSEFDWKSSELFYRDQGRINYLVDKLRIKVIDFGSDGRQIWGGNKEVNKVELSDVFDDKLEYKFVHWAGEIPRPTASLFSKGPLFRIKMHALREFKTQKLIHFRKLDETPGYSLWKYYNERLITLKDIYRFTLRDAILITRRVCEYLCNIPRKIRPSVNQ